MAAGAKTGSAIGTNLASTGAAGYDVSVARYAYIPSLALDFFYGIDANQFAFRTQHPTADPALAYRQNLGYSAQATLNIPVWNWGATRSKIKQAELKQQQESVKLFGAVLDVTP